MYVKSSFSAIYSIYSNDPSFYKTGGPGSLIKFDKRAHIPRYMLEHCEYKQYILYIFYVYGRVLIITLRLFDYSLKISLHEVDFMTFAIIDGMCSLFIENIDKRYVYLVQTSHL